MYNFRPIFKLLFTNCLHCFKYLCHLCCPSVILVNASYIFGLNNTICMTSTSKKNQNILNYIFRTSYST